MAETLPVQEQQQAEPVAHYDFQKRKFKWAVNVVITSAPVSVKIEPMPLYAAPLQRPWVGLTDEEIMVIGDKVANEHLVGLVSNFRARLARAIEQTLKELNK